MCLMSFSCVVNKESYAPEPDPGAFNPPPRYAVGSGTVILPDDPAYAGGKGAGSSSSGSSGGSFAELPRCSSKDETRCCFPAADGSSGMPDCSWRRLAPGQRVALTSFKDGDGKIVTLSGFELFVVAPTQVNSKEECNVPNGFVLSGPGLSDSSWGATGGFAWDYVMEDGAWQGVMSGGGSVATRNSDPGVSRDGPPPEPNDELKYLCESVKAGEKVRGLVSHLYSFTFSWKGGSYSWTGPTDQESDKPTSYYFQVYKAY
jgi:hypothetical protein